jgi:hypothetical protein
VGSLPQNQGVTRPELQPYENSVVHFQGWIESWTAGPQGAKDVLLKQVLFAPYSLDKPEEPDSPRPKTALHHVWLRVPAGAGYDRMRRLDPVFAYGRVGWYKRRDRSVDLGFQAVRAAPGGAFAEEILEALNSGNWAAAERRLREIKRDLENAELVVFDPKTSARTLIADLERRLLPLIKANQAALGTAPRRGKGRAPSSFASLLR